MSILKYIYPTIAGLVLMVFLSGCALIKDYGKLSLEYGPGENMTIQKLEKSWQDYYVYYDGVDVQSPSAVIFDPKNDGRKLVPSKQWMRIENQQELSEVIEWLWGNETLGETSPILWRILGPDNHFYGYLYTPWHHALIKVIDKNTLWVHDIPLPPISTGPNVMTGTP